MMRRSKLQNAFLLRSHGLGSRVVSGATYQMLGMILRTVVSIGSTAVLARLLLPAHFGYVAMAMVVTEFAALFADFGLTNVLIQRRRISRLAADTVFWASTLLGVLLATAVFAASFLSGVLFTDPFVGELLQALCVTFVISALGTIPHVVIARLMRFDLQFLMQVVVVTSRAAIAIVLAWQGYGVWSLVAGAIGGVLIQAIVGLSLVGYRPRLRFAPGLIMGTWRTSSSYFAGGLLFYASMNLDLIVIGRQLGATSLGFYQNARSLTDEIRARLAVPLQHVLFPAMSALQAERGRMQSVVLKSGRLLAAVVLPIGFGVSATAEELVPVLYGPQWLPMVPLVSMLGLSAGLRASMVVASPIFNSCDRVGLGVKHSAMAVFLLVGGVWLAAAHGMQAIAYAVALTSLYVLVPFVVALRLIGLGAKDAWNIIGRPLIAASLMWACVAAARPVTASWTEGPFKLLLLHAVLGAVAYAVALHSLSRQYAQDFRDFLSTFASTVRRKGADV